MSDRVAKRIKKLKRSIKNSKRMQRLKSEKKNEISDFLNLMKTELKVLETKNYDEFLIESSMEIDVGEHKNDDELKFVKFEAEKNDKKIIKNENIPIDKNITQVINKTHIFEKSARESLKEIAEINPLCNIKSDIDGKIWAGIIYWFKTLFFDEIKP